MLLFFIIQTTKILPAYVSVYQTPHQKQSAKLAQRIYRPKVLSCQAFDSHMISRRLEEHSGELSQTWEINAAQSAPTTHLHGFLRPRADRGGENLTGQIGLMCRQLRTGAEDSGICRLTAHVMAAKSVALIVK
jgi:uncharacterized protein YozE (UPF0346 family)